METFLVRLKTADGMPLAIAGFCEKEKEAYEKALSALHAVAFGTCRSEFAVDWRLQQMLHDCLPEELLKQDPVLGASLCVPHVTGATGGILGHVTEMADSAEVEAIDEAEYFSCTHPGRAAFCVLTKNAEIRRQLQQSFFADVDGSRSGCIRFYQLLRSFAVPFLLLADGSGTASQGFVATDKDIVWLDEVEREKEAYDLHGLKRIGILGGTFDPIHYGHLLVADTVQESLHLDKLLFVPTGTTTYRDQARVTCADWRCRMVQLAVEGKKKFAVSTYEAGEDKRIIYTIDTIRHFKSQCDTDASLFFIVGADCIPTIRYWKDFPLLSTLCALVFVSRPNWPLDEYTAELDRLRTEGVSFQIINSLQIDISSTQIRKKIKEGRSIQYLVPERVAEFIYTHGLYEAMPEDTLDKTLQVLQKREAGNVSLQQKLKLIKHCLDGDYGNCMIADRRGRMLYVNKTMLQMYHISEEKALSMTVYDLVKEGIIDHSAVQRVLETGQEVLEKLNIMPTGVEIDCIAKPVFDDGGQLQYVTAFSHERSFMRQFDSQLQKEREKRKTMKDALLFMQKANSRERPIVCADARIKELYYHLRRLAQTDSTIILYGESGVGKDVVANYIYNNSRRNNEIFMPVNCGAIPENLMESEFFGYEKGAFTGADVHGKKGIFEMSNHGTVFLDEIGEMPLFLQQKLLRFLDSGEIKRIGGNEIVYSDVRLIVATNRDLKKMVQEGTFREDLYYRLHTIPVYIPPLRERPDDIDALAATFLQEYNKKYGVDMGFSEDELTKLHTYSWPGNIRELRSTVERFVVTRGHLDVLSQVPVETKTGPDETMRPAPVRKRQLLKEAKAEFEKDYLQGTLEACDWNVREAARALGIHRSVLYAKIEKYDLTKKQRKS